MIPVYFVQIAFQLTELFQIEIDAVIYRINPPIRRGFFQKKKPPKIQTRLIIEVFGHIGIFGKVRWCHVVTENADLQNR